MKKISILFGFISSILFNAQINETLKELGVNEIEIDKAYNGDFIKDKNNKSSIDLKNNKIFKKVSFLTSEDSGDVYYVNLEFISKKTVKDNKDFIKNIVSKNFGDLKENFSSREGEASYSGRKGLESVYLSLFDKGMFDVSGVTFKKLSVNIKEKSDDFLKTKIYIADGDYTHLYTGDLSDEIIISFQKFVKNNEENVFLTISKKDKRWSFIEKVMLLVDDEVITLDAESRKDIDERGNTIEMSAIHLPQDLVAKLYNANIIKMRVMGRVNNDFTFNEIQKIAIRKIVDKK